jgi:hypothetical protein
MSQQNNCRSTKPRGFGALLGQRTLNGHVLNSL